MAYYDDASLEVAQVLFKHLQCLDVQVVRRLVEYKEIGVRHKHSAQVKTAFLATTQLVDIAVLLLRREEEMLQELRCCEHLACNGNYLGNILYNIYDFHLFIEREAILAVVSPFYRFAHLNGAAVGCHAPHQHLYESRFSGAVVAHDAQFLIAGECVEEVLCYNFAAKGF